MAPVVALQHKQFLVEASTADGISSVVPHTTLLELKHDDRKRVKPRAPQLRQTLYPWCCRTFSVPRSMLKGSDRSLIIVVDGLMIP